MQLTRHCALCENEVKSLKKGVTCKMNGEKPDFSKTCANILLDEKFQTKLENIHLLLERLNQKKNWVFSTFYVSIIIGFLLINSKQSLR